MTAKVTSLGCVLLFRLLLPAGLFAACIVRYNALSFLYGVFLLILPLLGTPDSKNIKGATGVYLKLLVALSALAVLGTSIFHIVLFATGAGNGPLFQNCTVNEQIARQVLVERLEGVPVLSVSRLVVPDAVVLVLSILVLAVCTALIRMQERAQGSQPLLTTHHIRRRKVNTFCSFLGDFLLILLLGLSGIVLPSVLNGVYFLVFLSVATLWACYRNMGRRFARVRVLLLVYSGLHLCLLHLYQFQFFQEFLPHSELIPRILGLTALVATDCDQPWLLTLHKDVMWPYYVNPACLLLLYGVLAVKTRLMFSSNDTDDGNVLTEGQEDVGREKRRRKKRRNEERQCLVEDGDKTNYSSVESGARPAPLSASQEDVHGASVSIQSPETEDEDEVEDTRRERRGAKRTPLISILVYIMKQSYVLSLIGMMAWSITFHSWLTFVLLLGACILWMVPQSRHACLVVSPVVVFYGEVLFLVQYVYGMNLPELPTRSGSIMLSEVGLMKFPYPCLQLGLQCVFLLSFWLTLRQFMRERKTWGNKPQGYAMEPVERSPHRQAFSRFLNLPLDTSDLIDGYDSNTITTLGRCLWHILCKYWIFVCIGMQLLISLQDVVVYRIIYMILLLLFLLCFQLSYTLWRLTMLVFWWVVIIYSMAVLIMIYTFQFSQFPMLWQNNTGLSPEVLMDIGLEQYDTAGLFLKLLTPTSFLIIVIIQVHYFHRSFLKLSALDRHVREDVVDSPPDNFTTDDAGATTATTDTEGRIVKQSRRLKRRMLAFLKRKWHWLGERWAEVSLVLWRLAQIHMYKLVFFVIMVVCASEVSAISAVYVILLCIFMPLSRFHVVLSHIAQLWTCLVLLAKTMYQLRLVKTDFWITNCTNHIDTTMVPLSNASNATAAPQPLVPLGASNITVADNARWVGLVKIYPDMDIATYLRNFLFILLVISLERIIHYHQTQHYNHPRHPTPPQGIVFPEVKRENADTGMKECIKFFFNYFFYKFGLEVCYLMMAVTISVRVDAYAVLYAIFLGVLLLLNRRQSAFIWPVLTIVLAIILPMCFLSSLGFPLGLCLVYPWKHETQFDRNLEQWLFLPDYANSPNALKLLADFFQLLFVCLQWRVFVIERSAERDEYGGGSNDSILPEVEAYTPIPVKDFTTKRTSYLDVLKYFVFVYMFWVTLAIVFITGTTRINLFSMGYVIAVFCFMWYGQEFLLKPLRRLLRMWNFLIGYNFFVLFAKACLQLVGCVYVKELYRNQCWLIQLLSVFCLSAPDGLPQGIALGDTRCEVQRDDTGLSWDVVCFVFLLLQRRIYSSQYFRHVVDEQEAQNRLASRGAELINRIIIREVNKQKETEKEILLNIKKKMKVLKERQARLKKDFKEPDEHYLAIRSGDYYLFEEEEVEATYHASTLSFGQGRDKEKVLGPLQMISTAMDVGTQAAIERQRSTASTTSVAKSTTSLDRPSSPSAESHLDGAAAEPVPGTSQQGREPPAEAEEEEEEEETEPEKAIRATQTWLTFLVALLGSLADWLISLFNRISRNYRLVARKLNEDMKVMKQKIQDEKRDIVAKGEDSHSAESQEREDEAADADLVQVSVAAPKPAPPPALVLTTTEGISASSLSLDDLEDEGEQEGFEQSQSGRPFRLMEAIYYVLISRSELLCYLLMILNQMIYCSLLSLPLPLMVFLWGMLSVPRPSKTFWITVITYTEAVVVTKYLFQFGFFPWNNSDVHDNPFWPPKIMGIEQRSNYASADLALLLALFIHRSILKRYGLWKDTNAISEDVAKAGEKEFSPPTSPDAMDDTATLSLELAQDSEDVQVAPPAGEAGDGCSTQSKKKRKQPPGRLVTGLKRLVQPFRDFFNEVTGFTYNATTDVYAPMFACDFITFFIVVFGYWAFGPATSSGGGDVTSYISENRVPVPFLIMLIVQFVLIIIDRALFLRKNVLGKFVFQLLLVILVHVWLFFVLPGITNRSFSDNVPAQIWYFVKCIYFALSAYQIRCGYPTRILGNFLTKKYNYLNLFLFKGFLTVPFLLELRALMDWIWTDTTLALSSWLQMEDIYANVFVLKCWRRAEETYPTPRSKRRKLAVKYGLGGLLLVLIIFIIWFPLVIFSIANTVFEVNPPYETNAMITVGGYQPIFQVSAQQQNIRPVTDSEYSLLRKHYSKKEVAVGFISNYEARDISVITLNGKSTSLWGISPPSRAKMVQQLNSTEPVRMEFSVSFHREPDAAQADTISNQFSQSLSDAIKAQLAQLIENSNSNESVTISILFPRYIRLSSKGRARPVDSLLTGESGIGFSNVTFMLYSNKSVANLAPILQWWGVQEKLQGSLFTYDPQAKPQLKDELTIVTFNDRKAPTGFSFITGYGIIGLYVSLVLVLGRFFRVTFFTGMSLRIMFDELPYVDRILQLCLDIYMVRETGDMRMEEELFAKLLFLYRSPETLIKWTMHPKED